MGASQVDNLMRGQNSNEGGHAPLALLSCAPACGTNYSQSHNLHSIDKD